MAARRPLLLLVALAVIALSSAAPASAQSFISSGGQATISADEGCVIIRTQQLGGASITIAGTFTGQAEIEVNNRDAAAVATCDTGNGWSAKEFTPSDGGSGVSSLTAAGTWDGSISGYLLLRVRASALSDGDVTVTIATGQGGGSGGGGGGASGTVDITAVGGNAVTTSLPVECSNCDATGVVDVDNSTFTLGTDQVVPIAGYADETSPGAATENRVAMARITLQRGLHTNPRDAAGAELFGTAAAAADNTANPTLGGHRSFLHVFDGSTWDRWTGAITGTVTVGSITAGNNNIGDVDVASIAAGNNNIGDVDVASFPDNEPFNLAQVGGTSVVTGGVNGTVGVGGTAAHDATRTGNPVRIGGRSSAAAPASVSADDEAVDAWFLRNGAQATVLTAAGALIGGDATNGVDVDVTRMPADATELPAAAALADNTANPTVPAVAAHLMAFNGSTWDRMTVPISACDDPSQVSSVPIDTASSGNVQLVALTASQTVFVCGYDVQAHGTVGVQFIYGTGTACATDETNLTGVYNLEAREGLVRSNGGAVQFKGAVSNALCVELSAGVQVSGVLTYVKRVP